jgi:hypothetical protein
MTLHNDNSKNIALCLSLVVPRLYPTGPAWTGYAGWASTAEGQVLLCVCRPMVPAACNVMHPSLGCCAAMQLADVLLEELPAVLSSHGLLTIDAVAWSPHALGCGKFHKLDK